MSFIFRYHLNSHFTGNIAVTKGILLRLQYKQKVSAAIHSDCLLRHNQIIGCSCLIQRNGNNRSFRHPLAFHLHSQPHLPIHLCLCLDG